MQTSQRSVYTAHDFIQWRESETLNVTPKFQRRDVWKTPARSFFIDTLLREMPVPPIYLRIVPDPETGRVVREVIDGQQRISSVLDFIDGKFRLSRNLGTDWSGTRFEELSIERRQSILQYSFSAEVFQGISDEEVLKIFTRLNTYSVPLNRQELRNGKYFGVFKRLCYDLAREHLEFWRRHRVFSEIAIARMLEVELTSELLVASLHGMQDKKTSLDRYYKEYDDDLSGQGRLETQFRAVVDTISESVHDDLRVALSRRPTHFYTLYCALFHHMFGLPGVRLESPHRRLNAAERIRLREVICTLGEVVDAAKADEAFPRTYRDYVLGTIQGQTDNLHPRELRLRGLYRLVF